MSSAGPTRGPVTAAEGARPLSFGPAPGLFGWYLAPEGDTRGVGVVICQALHYEGICAHRAMRKLAELLAREGFAVLRFDYAGTGDSPGDDREPGRVAAWLASVQEARAELQRLSGAGQVALVGLRGGALLAAFAASAQPVADLVLWAPLSGRAWVREVKAFNAMRTAQPPATRKRRAEAGLSEGEETAGFLLTHETMADLSALDLRKLPAAPAQRALIIDRDDVAGDARVADRLLELGVDARQERLPGYRAMMAYPHESQVPDQVWASVAGFLSQAHPRGGAAASGAGPGPAAFGSAGVREEAIRFAGGRLFGILSEPLAGRSRTPRACALLLTMASHHRIGPNRLHTRWARELPAHGIATLRFDVSGTGDSEPNQTGVENAPYALDQVADVSAAIDHLRGRGFERFTAVGFCSGGYLAWHAALSDARLSGLVLINPQTFEWKPGDAMDIDAPRTSTAEFKSTRFYRKALFDAATWQRLFSGQVHLRAIAAEVAGRLAARARTAAGGALARLSGAGSPKGPVLEGFEALAARATDVLLVFGQEDVGIDYIESHLGPDAARMQGKPGFRMLTLEGGTEHTFGQMWAQDQLTEILVDHLGAQHP